MVDYGTVTHFIAFYRVLSLFIGGNAQKWPEMAGNRKKRIRNSTKFYESWQKFTKVNIHFQRSGKKANSRVGEAWPFGTRQQTFGALQYARILSAGFWQNKGCHGKIHNFVI